MSRIYFHSPTRTADLKGSERAHLGSLLDSITFGMFDLTGYGNADRLQELVSPERRLIHGPGQLLTWARDFQASFRAGLDGEVLSYKGRPIESFALALNTALLVGNDQIKLAARLHGQCELHAYVEGPNRAWLADIMQQGLASGIYRKGRRAPADPETPDEQGRWISQGWDEVIELLRSCDDEPVVASYSVCDSFPNEMIARWEPAAGTELTPSWAREAPDEWAAMTDSEREDYRGQTALEQWDALSTIEQWRLGMAGLRSSGRGLEIKPSNWKTFRYEHQLSVLDLYADDWEERVESALEIERQDA